MPNECEMGFGELFRRARNREWTAEEAGDFAALDQDSRNRLVRQLAKEAGGIRTADRTGTDGIVYTAFWADS